MLRLLGILALGNMIFGENRCRRNGSFLGMLFILPALMCGGWIVLAVVGGMLGLVGTVLGGIFSGLSSLVSSVFSGREIVLSIIIGLAAYYYFRNRKMTESTVEEE